LLSSFVNHFGEEYGPDHLIYNIHTLTHLASHVRLFGALHNLSGFPFENYL
jgi:hypothetical protein